MKLFKVILLLLCLATHSVISAAQNKHSAKDLLFSGRKQSYLYLCGTRLYYQLYREHKYSMMLTIDTLVVTENRLVGRYYTGEMTDDQSIRLTENATNKESVYKIASEEKISDYISKYLGAVYASSYQKCQHDGINYTVCEQMIARLRRNNAGKIYYPLDNFVGKMHDLYVTELK